MLGAEVTVKTRATRWLGLLARVVAVVVPLLVSLDRFRRPSVERFVFPAMGGSADLWLPYLGARAILEHLDPYGPLPDYLREPSNWPSTYPPTMLALYVPLVWATGSDIELACQVMYWINIAALGALSFITWQLSLRLVPPGQRTDSSFLLILIALSLNVPTLFAVDRGQSEIISATLCWGAVLLFVQGKHGWAAVAVTLSGAIKGYAVPMGVGLVLATLATRGRKQFVHALVGGAVTTLAVTVPVARYLRHGFESMAQRTDFAFAAAWYNHSFTNTFFQFSPSLADAGRRWTLVLACVTAVGAWLRLFMAVRKGATNDVTLRVVVFAGSALAVAIGFPAFAGPYNYVLVLPALILASTRYEDLCAALKLRAAVAIPLGLVLVVALAFALRLRLLDSYPTTLAGIALVALVACLGVITAAGSRRLDAASEPARHVTRRSARVDSTRDDGDAAAPLQGEG